MSDKLDFAKNPNPKFLEMTTGTCKNIMAGNEGNVGCTVFRNRSSNGYSDITVGDHIRYYIEPNVGAHYYAHSYTGTYKRATCRIPLSRCVVENLKDSNRTACVSIGMGSCGSKYKMCDVGLSNQGDGWYPTCWCRGFLKSSGNAAAYGNKFYRAGDIDVHVMGNDPYNKLSGNEKVTITVEVGTTRTMDYVRAEFSYNGKTGSVAFYVPKGQMHQLINGDPKVHFYRFMSLVPTSNDETKDDADNSASSTVMDHLKIDGSSWTANNIQFAWVMQPKNAPDIRISNITPKTIGSDADYANIKHTVQTH